MIGLRVMQHEDGREYLRIARASRLAQVDADKYRAAVRDEELMLGLR